MSEGAESSASESFSSEEETSYSPQKLMPMVIPDTEPRTDVPRDTLYQTPMVDSKAHGYTKDEKKLMDYFASIICNLKENVTIYPDAMDKYLQKVENTTFKYLMNIFNVKGPSFIFVTKSLAITLNIENPRLRLPNSVVLDVCVFTHNSPVQVLTIANKSTSDRTFCEKYNTFIARGLTEALRSEDRSVSVINGVLDDDQRNDIQQKLNDFQRRQCMFKQFGRMTHVRCETLIRCLLTSIAICKTVRHWDNEVLKHRNVMLKKEEFLCLLNELDGTAGCSKTNRCSVVFILEYICRLSRGYKVLMDVPNGLIPRYTLDSLSNYLPLLEISFNGEGQYVTNFAYKVTVRRAAKGINWKLTAVSRTVSQLTTTTSPISGTHEKVRALTTTVVPFMLYLVMFLIWEETPASVLFALAKCNPVLHLILKVFSFWDQNNYNQECLWLLIGLTLSCIGDILLVWKHIYLLPGIITFAAAHLSYAQAFGLKFDNLRALVLTSVLTVTVFAIFSRNLDSTTFWVLFLYMISITTMGWRALAKVHSMKSPWQLSTYFSVLSAVCFFICNIVFGHELFWGPFFGSHALSMVTYYVAQLGITLSVMTGVLTRIRVKNVNWTYILLVLCSLFMCWVPSHIKKLTVFHSG